MAGCVGCIVYHINPVLDWKSGKYERLVSSSGSHVDHLIGKIDSRVTVEGV